MLVVVGGPTASGKTALAIEIAIRYNTEIISADSRQFFRELSIGTAKPDRSQLDRVRHHFVDSHNIVEEFNAGRYGIEARKLLVELFADHDVVVMAGGSGLYIDSVLFGIDDLPASDKKIRAELKTKFNAQGIDLLESMLRELDPGIIGNIDIKNPQRVIRALEVTLVSGKPYSEQLGSSYDPLPWNWMITGIDMERNQLYANIDSRVRNMIQSGLVDEVKNVVGHRKANALQTVGYKEMFEYIDGLVSLDEAIEKIARHTRNYAKRQLTWFRRYPEMLWINPGEPGVLFSKIDEQISLPG